MLLSSVNAHEGCGVPRRSMKKAADSEPIIMFLRQKIRRSINGNLIRTHVHPILLFPPCLKVRIDVRQRLAMGRRDIETRTARRFRSPYTLACRGTVSAAILSEPDSLTATAAAAVLP